MTNSGLTVRAWNDAAIARRDEDGFANATAMCQANGKLWADYQRTARTSDYIEALATSLDLTPADLVITTTTGPNEFRGTWIHPRLAVDLARWISPEFAVWMDGWFLEQLEHQQPQPQGLTAEDVARIAIEAARTVQGTVQTVHMPAGSEEHHAISCSDAIISVMADAHSRGHHLISRTLLVAGVAQRFGYAGRTIDNTMPALIRSRQVVRHSHGRYRLSPLPTIPKAKAVKQLTLEPANDLVADMLYMNAVREAAIKANGPITAIDTFSDVEAAIGEWPVVGRIICAMQALHTLGLGAYDTETRLFKLTA